MRKIKIVRMNKNNQILKNSEKIKLLSFLLFSFWKDNLPLNLLQPLRKANPFPLTRACFYQILLKTCQEIVQLNPRNGF